MKIRATRSIAGDYGRIGRNETADLDETLAAKLIKRGVAVAVEDEKPTEKPARKAKAD